jgi:hypothetical protein
MIHNGDPEYQAPPGCSDQIGLLSAEMQPKVNDQRLSPFETSAVGQEPLQPFPIFSKCKAA